MALLSKKAFATLCGLKSTRELAVYIKRKKVKMKKDRISDADPVNVKFMKELAAKRKLRDQPVVETPLSEDEEAAKDELFNQLKTKGDLDLQQRRNNIVLQTIEIQKKQGQVVPTAAVRSLVITHSESIKTSYTEAADNLLVIIAQKHQLSSKDLADLRTQFLKLTNKAIDSAIEMTKKSLSTIVKEYSLKRGVGEHD